MRALMRVKSVVAACSALALVLASCTQTADDDTSNTIVTIVSIEGIPADTQGVRTVDLFSDVCSNDGPVWPPGCTAGNDFGEVVMLARPKAPVTALGPGQYNDVVFERYRVTYIRADGRNTPGVDVPYPFDGVLTFRVPIEDSTTRVFTVVRQQAKLEPPLRNLAGNGGALVISTLAQIDFYGKDVAGRAITVRGHLNIMFGDFG